MKNNCLFFLFCILLASCHPANHAPGELSKALNAIIEADNRGDIDAILAQYSDDAILMPSGRENITGREAIRKNYEGIFSDSRLQIYPVVHEIMQSGNLGVIRGEIRGIVTAKSNNSITPVNDKFVMILGKNSSEWKIQRLIWSRNE